MKIKQKIQTKIMDKMSLKILRQINERIEERNFHEQTHVLYDLAELLEQDKLVYCEIGSYVGSSASLMLENQKIQKVFCIDPLNLNKTHFRGSEGQEKVLNKNLSKYNKSRYSIFKNYSSDNEVLQFFENNNVKFDILFIDGDHSKKAVINDFNNYKRFLKTGSFLVFDDYLDFRHSPQVKIAVNHLISQKEVSDDFEIIGLLNGPALEREYGTFIMRKR